METSAISVPGHVIWKYYPQIPLNARTLNLEGTHFFLSMAVCRMATLRVPACRVCASRIISITTTRFPGSKRQYSQTSSDLSPPPNQQNPRWLSDLRSRIGRCLTFGLKTEQTQEAASVLEELANDWRELVAGSEGFLTGLGRKGLERQKVVWGEMDVMVFVSS